MYWWMILDSRDNYDWDDPRHYVDQVALFWAKDEKEAKAMAKKWGFHEFDMSGRFKTIKDAKKSWKDNQKGNPPHRRNEIDFAVKDGKMMKGNQMNEGREMIDEGFGDIIKSITNAFMKIPGVSNKKEVDASNKKNFERFSKELDEFVKSNAFKKYADGRAKIEKRVSIFKKAVRDEDWPRAASTAKGIMELIKKLPVKKAYQNEGRNDGKVLAVVSESYKMHYPSLKKFAELEYGGDPRDCEGKKIVAEKDGYFKKGDEVIEGTYVVYEDEAFPGSYIGVHVSKDINEDSGDPTVNMVAMDPNKKNVINRVSYRSRTSGKSVDPSDRDASKELSESQRMLKNAGLL